VNEGGLNFRVGMMYIIEYLENPTGPNGFDSSDSIISRVPFYSPSTNIFLPLTEKIGMADDANYYFYQSATVDSLRTSDLGPSIANLSCGMSDLRGYIVQLDAILSPIAWEWTLGIDHYPYQGDVGTTRLAIKFVVESSGPRTLRPTVPLDERDDSSQEMTDILVQLKPNNHSSLDYYDNLDKGYFSWPKLATEQYGTYKNGSPYAVDYLTHDRPVDVLFSELLSPEDDIDPQSEAVSILDSYGNYEDETRSFIYISFPVEQPVYLVWDPYVGVDATDPNGDSATSAVSGSQILDPHWIWIAMELGAVMYMVFL